MDAALLTDSLPADVAGWWVSEKYDGVRAIWTGTKLLSRNGKDLNPPAWFTKDLPKRHRLDGEIFLYRGGFNELVSVIQDKELNWRNVTYLIFDLAEEGSFEDRQETLGKIKLPKCSQLVKHVKLTSHSDLTEMERKIVAAGGEGCVIRRPGSPYRPGRMGDVIKVKRLVSDVERWQG